MNRFARTRLPLAALAVVLLLGIAPPGASAHNSFESSTPADGDVLDAAPSTISMVFTKAVPLDSASVQVIDATGARTSVDTLTHGPAGETEIVAALPALVPGEVTVRWRLVSDDGHPLTGRVEFRIGGAAPPTDTTPASTDMTSNTTQPDPGDTTQPGTDSAIQDPGAESFDEPSGTSDVLRWLLRYGSYLAIAAVVGILLTDLLVWPGAARLALLRSLVDRSLAAIAVLALIQLLVLASDLGGGSWWGSWSDIDDALRTSAGLALFARIVLAAAVWIVTSCMSIGQPDVRIAAAGIAGALLLGTWAWAGHSVSQRWSEIGVPLDVVHHAAAALWIGALGIVAFVASRRLDVAAYGAVVARLSTVAATAVLVIVATGVVQSVRLVGGPGRLLDVAHGRYLVAKVAVVALMLVLARMNRQRVGRLAHDASQTDDILLAHLRRSVSLEFALGLLVIAITATLVVSPPSAAL